MYTYPIKIYKHKKTGVLEIVTFYGDNNNKIERFNYTKTGCEKMKVKCNHCGKQAKINISLNDTEFHYINKRCYCEDCINNIVKFYYENSNLI